MNFSVLFQSSALKFRDVLVIRVWHKRIRGYFPLKLSRDGFAKKNISRFTIVAPREKSGRNRHHCYSTSDASKIGRPSTMGYRLGCAKPVANKGESKRAANLFAPFFARRLNRVAQPEGNCDLRPSRCCNSIGFLCENDFLMYKTMRSKCENEAWRMSSSLPQDGCFMHEMRYRISEFICEMNFV